MQLVIETLDDELLMRKLEEVRGRGRDDYTAQAVLNSLLAEVVFQHKSIESLRRELSRNGDLLGICGFENHYIKGMKKMKLRCSKAMIVMLATAPGRAREKKFDSMRPLVKAA